MAKFASTSLVFLLLTLVGYVFTLPLPHRDVDHLEHDLELFSGDVSGLSNAITLYSYPKPFGLSVPSEFALTKSDLQRCIDDIKRIQYIDRRDAAIILKIIQDFKPTVMGMLRNLQHKKPMFKKLHMVPFILEELKDLQRGMAELMGKLAKVLPPQLQGEADSLQANMGASFHKTISLYSSK